MSLPADPLVPHPMPLDDTTGPAPKVSVVIPAWNRRGSLRMSVESVLRQTFTDFELIVVDDGSTDGTMEAIADITDPRLRRLAHEVNRGVSAARNTGIKAARGAWVAFQDSDDEWLPLKLEKQMARLEGAGPEVVGCYTGIAEILKLPKNDGRTSLLYVPAPPQRIVEGDLYLAQFYRWFVAPQTLMVRRSELLAIGCFDESMLAHEDRDLTLRLAQRGRFLLVDEPLVFRRYSDNSIVRDEHKMMSEWEGFFKKYGAAMAASCPQVLVRQHVVNAGKQRRMGDVKGARASLAAAARVRPFSLAIRLRQLRLLGATARRRT